MTKEYENSTYNRDTLIHHYAVYSEEEAARIRESVGGKTTKLGVYP
jgi:hypothetical protein